jgi:hypothetical protein
VFETQREHDALRIDDLTVNSRSPEVVVTIETLYKERKWLNVLLLLKPMV